MKVTTRIDPAKLLGFKLLVKDPAVVRLDEIGAKVGSKNNDKVGDENNIGSFPTGRIGSKVGGKNPNSPG